MLVEGQCEHLLHLLLWKDTSLVLERRLKPTLVKPLSSGKIVGDNDL